MNRITHIACLFAFLALVLPARAQDSVVTLAGQALVSGATNGFGTNAQFHDPAALAADASGNLFITDNQNHAIRKLDTNGNVTTLAGLLGVAGTSDGTGSQARFDSPSGIALDSAGNLFVADTGNHTIRKITSAGVVTTLAGWAGQSGSINATGPAARFNFPLGLARATNGTLYVADSGNHLIRAITTAGVVSTLAGSPGNWGSSDGDGTNARFNGPVGLALDDAGNLLISDSNNHTIRRVTPAGVATTWAGAPDVDGCVDGNRLAARFSKPAELTFDRKGNLFVADSFNHVIRMISSNGLVSTVAGRPGTAGSGDGINGHARLFNPYGLAVRLDGSLALADAYNETIRAVVVPFRVGIQISGASPVAVLSWDSVVGRAYQAQSATMPGSGPWLDVGIPITATNLTTTVTDGAGAGSQRVYRILLLP
jgi:hypothetical protein